MSSELLFCPLLDLDVVSRCAGASGCCEADSTNSIGGAGAIRWPEAGKRGDYRAASSLDGSFETFGLEASMKSDFLLRCSYTILV